MPPRHIDLLPVLLSFTGALALTPAVRSLARRSGMVARPRADRWHTEPTALMGGIAIFATVAAVAAFVPCTPEALVVLGASSFLFLLGLLDDFLNLKPHQKLIGQAMGAAMVISSGLTLHWSGSPTMDAAITLFWLVGITNAVNLLDNMDGLAAGIAVIASSCLAIDFLGAGQVSHALLTAVFGAATLGFLVFNSNPASIFMGDSGSMFIGFFLSGAMLLRSTGGGPRDPLSRLAVPVLILLIPILDTLFVTVLRKRAGRPVSQGGRDHTSHRLVALGLPERRAVGLLYGFAALSGFLGLFVRDVPLDAGIAAIVGFTLALTMLGVRLAGVQVYATDGLRTAQDRPQIGSRDGLNPRPRIFRGPVRTRLLGGDGTLLRSDSLGGAEALMPGPTEELTVR